MKRRSTLPNDTSAEQSVAGPLILAGDAESANPPKIVAEEIEQMGSESESSLTELTDRISPLSRAVLTADSIEDLTQSAWARDVLARCCDKIVEHHKGFLHAQIAGLRHALAAGDYAVVIKSTVGHGNFRAFCESQLSSISFRRIEQFKWLAEHKEELLLLLRAENAKRSAHLSDEDLLAATSIRKAQRILHAPVDDSSGKRKAKKRAKAVLGEVPLTASDELLTPPAIIEAAIRLLGEIDLDPCASKTCPDHIPAKRSLICDDDGAAILRPWQGKALIHPPLSTVAEWVGKARLEYRSGRLTEGLLLVPAQLQEPWYLSLSEHPRAFLRNSSDFVGAEDSAANAQQPYVLVFLGPANRAADFAAAFADIADTYQPIPPAKVALSTDT